MPKNHRTPPDRNFIANLDQETQKRDKTIVVRVTQDQFNKLKANAKKLGVNLSAYIRAALSKLTD